MNQKTLIFLASLLPSWLLATSVYLVNDSSYPLRATVRANDGTYLGEMIIKPQSANSWSDGGNRSGGLEQYPASRTPYIVTWYCMNGSVFAVFDQIATGGTATALGGSGVKACKPPKKGERDKQH